MTREDLFKYQVDVSDVDVFVKLMTSLYNKNIEFKRIGLHRCGGVIATIPLRQYETLKNICDSLSLSMEKLPEQSLAEK